jgi:alpha-L-fucosidase
MSATPRYLNDYAQQWSVDPHQANLQWFGATKWGLFMHYGLYSQLGRGEWVMFQEQIPIAEYEKLLQSFNPERFDADYITDLALEAEMQYVTFTACHHEGFCLWKSDVEAYNSYAACGRDLVRELAEQCDRKGLGFFTYFTHVLNWRHPHAFTRQMLEIARPAYPQGDPRYQLTDVSEASRFWDWSHACIRELLELEFPLAGMWLDIIAGYYRAPDLVPIEDTYELIRGARPEALISFKQGATGTEDFAAPEHSANSMAEVMRKQGNERGAALADAAWEGNRDKHNEICMTLQRRGWGYAEDAEHLDADEVWGLLANALAHNCSLLANTGPLPDGSIHEGDAATLRALGECIRREGWPHPDDAITPDSWTVPRDDKGAQAQ